MSIISLLPARSFEGFENYDRTKSPDSSRVGAYSIRPRFRTWNPFDDVGDDVHQRQMPAKTSTEAR
jgi:hypothetical protein